MPSAFLDIQALLAGATPVVGALAVALSPEAQPWVAFAGVLVLFLVTLWLDPWKDRLREAAANIQEDFDCTVLHLPWNELLAGRRPDAAEIHEAAEKDRPAPEAPLKNWYPTIIDSLPLHQARVICQRMNCQWDSKLRRQYRTAIQVTLHLIGASVFVLGLLTGMDLQKFVLAVAVPLSPTLLLGMREVQRQGEAAVAVDCLKDFSESLWKGIVQGKVMEPEATSRSRNLQDAILRHRRTNPFIFDWVYRRFRKDYEKGMNISSEDMVAQVNDGSVPKPAR